MASKKPIDIIGGWDWETLVASWRYYEHGGSITAASFMEDIVERFFKDTKTYSDNARMQIANQFANIDHGLRGEEDWTKYGCGDDSAAKSWRKFYRFCEAWANNHWYTVVLDGKDSSGKHIHEEVVAFKFGDRFYPRDRYISWPSLESYCAPEFIKEIRSWLDHV